MQPVVDSAGLSVGSIFLVSVVSVFPAIHCDSLQFTAFVIQRARTITKEGNSSRLISQQTFTLIPLTQYCSMRTALFTDVGIYEACNNKVRYYRKSVMRRVYLGE